MARCLCLFEKQICGVSLRKACIFAGALDVILAVCLAVVCLFFALNVISILIAVLDITFAGLVIVGAIRRKSVLFWPFIILKSIFLAGSVLVFLGCVILVIANQFTEIHISRGTARYWTDVLGVLFGLFGLIFFVRTIVPALIIWSYFKELTRTNAEGIQMTTKYDDLNENSREI